MKKICLLDYLAWKLHLEYLSDIKKLSMVNKKRGADILSEIEGYDEFYPAEWIDACEYITGMKSENAEAARMQMLTYFAE